MNSSCIQLVYALSYIQYFSCWGWINFVLIIIISIYLCYYQYSNEVILKYVDQILSNLIKSQTLVQFYSLIKFDQVFYSKILSWFLTFSMINSKFLIFILFIDLIIKAFLLKALFYIYNYHYLCDSIDRTFCLCDENYSK